MQNFLNGVFVAMTWFFLVQSCGKALTTLGEDYLENECAMQCPTNTFAVLTLKDMQCYCQVNSQVLIRIHK